MVQETRDALTDASRDAVFMNAEDAATLRLRQGDPVVLESQQGRYPARVHLSPVKQGNLEVHWPEAQVLICRRCGPPRKTVRHPRLQRGRPGPGARRHSGTPQFGDECRGGEGSVVEQTPGRTAQPRAQGTPTPRTAPAGLESLTTGSGQSSPAPRWATTWLPTQMNTGTIWQPCRSLNASRSWPCGLSGLPLY
ncbi:MAG TPA: molybdopterin dinucleotide binding domain-containing protein [Thermoplasmata archaeon]|nr:molybdopterin dinucleotide binding domain-containing protein [Thermoplasmata archaeon]